MVNLVLLDIPTVYALTGLSSLAGAAILIWLRADHRASGPAMALFSAGILALGIGFVAFALRSDFADWAMPLIGYTALGASSVLIWLGSRHLLGMQGGVAIAAIAIAAVAFAAYAFALFTIREATASHAIARIVLSSLFVIAFMALAAFEAQRSPWMKPLRSVRMMRNLLVLFCVIVAARLAAFVVQGIPLLADGSSAPGVLRSLFATVFGALPFVITVSVLSIVNSQLSMRLSRMASTDDLTGLVSRRSLQESAERLLRRPAGEGCIALLMIDIDRFKHINDHHGHSVGDQVLRHVASVLRQVLRTDSLIVRYGGDEFCALVPVPGEAAAFIVAERLRAAMESSPYRLDGQRIAITLSIGVSMYRQGKTLRQLLDEADRRAYRAKADGRNRVVAEDAPVVA